MSEEQENLFRAYHLLRQATMPVNETWDHNRLHCMKKIRELLKGTTWQINPSGRSPDKGGAS